MVVMIMMRVRFVRQAERPDSIAVVRSDGSEASWQFPAYFGGIPPHDLVRLVVEGAFGIRDGFWGRIDKGAVPREIHALLDPTDKQDKYAAMGQDLNGLHTADVLSGAPWWTAS